MMIKPVKGFVLIKFPSVPWLLNCVQRTEEHSETVNPSSKLEFSYKTRSRIKLILNKQSS